MKDYYDSDEIYDRDEGDEVRKELLELEYAWSNGRPRFETVEKTYDFDLDFFNKLLNREDLGDNEAVKYELAGMFQYAVGEYIDSNSTAKSWEEFLQRRLGEEKYNRLMAEWLREESNSFWEKVGMRDQQKPATIYVFRPEEDEEDEE